MTGVRLRTARPSSPPHFLLASGIHPKVASERVGQKIGITLDLYSRVLPGMQEDATERVDAALEAAINRRSKYIG
jgi:hypothetical protein